MDYPGLLCDTLEMHYFLLINVQPKSQLRRDVRKRLFSLRIWSPRYKHVNKGNSNVKQSFDRSVTVRKSVPGVTLGEINCQSNQVVESWTLF